MSDKKIDNSKLDAENMCSMQHEILKIFDGSNPKEILIVLVRIIKIIHECMEIEPIEEFAEKIKTSLILQDNKLNS